MAFWKARRPVAHRPSMRPPATSAGRDGKRAHPEASGSTSEPSELKGDDNAQADKSIPSDRRGSVSRRERICGARTEHYVTAGRAGLSIGVEILQVE